MRNKELMTAGEIVQKTGTIIPGKEGPRDE